MSGREVANLQERERQLNIKIKSLSSKLRAEQDEVWGNMAQRKARLPLSPPLPLSPFPQVRRLKASIQYKEVQHSHEMRKREKEYSRLKQKLGQVSWHHHSATPQRGIPLSGGGFRRLPEPDWTVRGSRSQHPVARAASTLWPGQPAPHGQGSWHAGIIVWS